MAATKILIDADEQLRRLEQVARDTFNEFRKVGEATFPDYLLPMMKLKIMYLIDKRGWNVGVDDQIGGGMIRLVVDPHSFCDGYRHIDEQ